MSPAVRGVGSLTEMVTIVQPLYRINPDTGGQVPDGERLIGDVWAAIEPIATAESLLQARGIGRDVGVVNIATHRVTVWANPDITVGCVVHYGARVFEITGVEPDGDARAPFLQLACVERQA
jgi:head-tail adaptor